MEQKKILLYVCEKIHTIQAQIQTVSWAAGNRELLGDAPQSISLTLDAIGAELENCRRILEVLVDRKGIQL